MDNFGLSRNLQEFALSTTGAQRGPKVSKMDFKGKATNKEPQGFNGDQNGSQRELIGSRRGTEREATRIRKGANGSRREPNMFSKNFILSHQN